MLLLSDCPERLAGFFATDPAWTRVAPDDLAAADLALWAAVGTDRPLWTAQVAGPGALWSRALIVAEAPGSQYDALRTLMASPIPPEGPVACLALSGRDFHGQRGRPWVAPEGNLFLTVGISPQVPAAPLLASLVMLPAVAVVDAIARVTGDELRPGIKWVNDILIDGRKVAGVLTSTQTRSETLEGLVLGIGVNVAHAPEVTRSPFVPGIGCLAEAHPTTPPSVGETFSALLEALADRYDHLLRHGPELLFERYVAASVIIGRRVRIYPEGSDGPDSGDAPVATGEVLSIAPDLSLRLGGHPNPVTRGRLALE